MLDNFKITNFFKEIKKINKRDSFEIDKSFDCDIENSKRLESCGINIKSKFLYPYPQAIKTQKNIQEFGCENGIKEIEFKSTQSSNNNINDIYGNSNKIDTEKKYDRSIYSDLYKLTESTQNMNITEKQNIENNKINLIEKNINKTNSKKKHDSPQLSAKTLEIIQKIKDDRKNRFLGLIIIKINLDMVVHFLILNINMKNYHKYLNRELNSFLDD